MTRKTLFHGYIESLLFLPIYSRWPHLLVNHSPLGKADSLDAGCWDNRSRCRIRRDRPSFFPPVGPGCSIGDYSLGRAAFDVAGLGGGNLRV